MSYENNASGAVTSAEIVAQARETILGICPIEFLQPQSPEALAEATVADGMTANITPRELTAILANDDDLKIKIQKLVSTKELQTQLGGLNFNNRETELICQSFMGTAMFLKRVILPLFSGGYHNCYASVWHECGDMTRKVDGRRVALSVMLSKNKNRPRLPAKEIISALVASIQRVEPDNKTTPLVLETLARILPPEACKELSDLLRDMLSSY